MANEFLYGL